MEFVQTAGQAVMDASYWLKLEHCSSILIEDCTVYYCLQA